MEWRRGYVGEGGIHLCCLRGGELLGIGLETMDESVEWRDFHCADLEVPTATRVIQSGLLTQHCFIVLTPSSAPAFVLHLLPNHIKHWSGMGHLGLCVRGGSMEYKDQGLRPESKNSHLCGPEAHSFPRWAWAEELIGKDFNPSCLFVHGRCQLPPL